MPQAAQLLLEVGPDLFGSFVSGRALHARLKSATEGGSSLLDRLGRQLDAEGPAPGDLAQRGLYEQVEGLLIEVSAAHPLILVLDDLQWADSGSINLLFHLMRRMKGRRLMIVGAYRPEEVALGRGEEPHPLEKLLAEAKRMHGAITLDLSEEDQEQGSAFVEAFIDSEPNELGETFRQALAVHTRGHPLFTVELLRAMQERGDLIRAEGGKWVEGESLDWTTLPARVEGVIEERIGRLEEELRETLTIASVEGETFTAQVVAQVQQVGEREILKRLSRQLEKQHRLIHGGPESKVGEKLLSLYRFAHTLYQRYLYNDLSAGERRTLHRDVAEVLENLYEGSTDEICVQLAQHWEAAGELDRAEGYLQLAGDQARLAYAHETAVTHYQRAIQILKGNKEWEKAARSLMKLGLTHQTAFDYQRARAVFDEGFELWKRSIDSISPSKGTVGGRIRYARTEPTTLDPGLSYDSNSGRIIRHLFCGLVELTPDLGISPELAESWEISSDGLRIVFQLAEGLRWSDGVPLTAGDFEYAWKRNLHPSMFKNPAQLLYDVAGGESYHQGLKSDPDVVGVRAVGARVLEVELVTSCGYFLYLLAKNPVTFPIPRHAIETHGESWTRSDNLVCNGPFVVKDRVKGKVITLERNPHYHRTFRGNLDRVEILTEDLPSYIRLYETNQLDEVKLSSWEFQDAMAKYPDEYSVSPNFSTMFILFNLSIHPLNDVRIRRAFALATDREAWCEVLHGGSGIPAVGGVVPPHLPGSLIDSIVSFDPERAAKLIAEAGFPAGIGFPELSLMVTASGDIEQEHWLTHQWSKHLGINAQLEVVEWDKVVSRVRRGEYSLALRTWFADYPDSDSFLRTNITLFQGGWDHPEFRQLVNRARVSRDQNERVQLYQSAEAIIVDQVPVIPMSHERAHRLLKPWLRTFPISPMGEVHLKDTIVDPH
jgi:ABC-type oligopeptide transport system substrate-binding subunit